MGRAFCLVFMALVTGYFNEQYPNLWLCFAQFCFIIGSFTCFYLACKELR